MYFLNIFGGILAFSRGIVSGVVKEEEAGRPQLSNVDRAEVGTDG
jgi:hypothetical protein